MKCVFCNREYPLDAVVCVDCNEYKGMEEITPKPFTTLGSALDDAFALMEEARQHYLGNHTEHDDCDCREGEE